jgi:hypothetical protein
MIVVVLLGVALGGRRIGDVSSRGGGGGGGGGGGAGMGTGPGGRDGPVILATRLATNGNAIRASFVLHVETSFISLMGLAFYRDIPPELLTRSSLLSSSLRSSSTDHGKGVAVVGGGGGKGKGVKGEWGGSGTTTTIPHCSP